MNRAWNIPPGRVAQRVQKFQVDSHPDTDVHSPAHSATSKVHTADAAAITSRASPTRNPTVTLAMREPAEEEESIIKEEAGRVISPPPVPVIQEKAETLPPQLPGERTIERGRALHRASVMEPREQDDEELDQVLEDVRSRLYSVQNIVKRERSGSSQARDEMMDELGSMLDNAIATTMTPLHPSNAREGMVSSRGRRLSTSPAKQQLAVTTALSRSQSLKASSPSHSRFYDRRKDIASDISSASGGPLVPAPPPVSPVLQSFTHRVQNAPEKSPVKPHGPMHISSMPRHLFDTGSDLGRQRQVSEPMVFALRRTGFPLASPVRERRLL